MIWWHTKYIQDIQYSVIHWRYNVSTQQTNKNHTASQLLPMNSLQYWSSLCLGNETFPPNCREFQPFLRTVQRGFGSTSLPENRRGNPQCCSKWLGTRALWFIQCKRDNEFCHLHAHPLTALVASIPPPHLEAVRTRVILKNSLCNFHEPSRIESRNLVGHLLMNLFKTSFSSMSWPNSIPDIAQKTCPEPSGCPCSAHGGMKTLSRNLHCASCWTPKVEMRKSGCL